MKNTCYLFIVSIFVIVFSTCKHEPVQIITGHLTDTSTQVVPNDSVCFNTQILPLITANCAQSGCHDAIKHEEGLRLYTYNGIMSLGTANLVAQISKTSGKVMPPYPRPRMDTANINLIKRWINQGAKNRICTQAECDTANVKYSTHIAPLVNIYCKGCHNLSNKSGNVNLDNYTDVKTQSLTGKVLCSITATAGCGLMPKGGPAMNNCNIRKFQLWVAANCPQ